MKQIRKILACALALCLCISISIPASAAEVEAKVDNSLKVGTSPLLEDVSTFLDNSATTQTIVVSEREIINKMLENKTITREELNADLSALASKSEENLRQCGYNDKQIEIIKSYKAGEDAYNHFFAPQSGARSTFDADVTFRYGLAGSNTRRDITIAYDMQWSDCPFCTFTDSFGVGWVAADSMSHAVATKIDSSMATVNYYSVDGEYAYLYRDVEMNDFSNCVVIGNPILGSANGNYGKHIGGVTEISTQSDSYNIDTIQLFVAYGHTMLTIDFSWEVSLSFDISDVGISFGPSLDVTQEIMAQGKHTFRYNSQDVIVA